MIKYYDNNKENLYDENGKRISNWNPDDDYADNEYVHVYFRIECPAYYQNPYGVGFSNNADKQAFDKDVTDVFRNMGWVIGKYTSVSDRDDAARKGKSCLFLHPQNISGEVLKHDVQTIAEALAQHDTFHIRYVDIYQTVYDMDNDAYAAYLNTRKDDIKNLLLQACKTNRTRNFKYTDQIISSVGKKIYLHRIGCREADWGFIGSVTGVYIDNVINELAEQGYLIRKTHDGYDIVRTINKTEQKKLKLYID